MVRVRRLMRLFFYVVYRVMAEQMPPSGPTKMALGRNV